MRTRNEIERLADAGRPLLAEADNLADAADEDLILDGILATPRPKRRRQIPRRRAALVLVAAALAVAAIAAAASGVFSSSATTPRSGGGTTHAALSGATFKLAGYHFKTPAGFKASDAACAPPASAGQPETVLNRFASAASADGGCVEAFLLVPGSSSAPPATPADSEPVAVGSYQGYFVSSDSTLYVALSTVNGPSTYLVLYAQGLTEDQLIAVAQSGLPSSSAAGSNTVVHK